jgi:hypothetical protein
MASHLVPEKRASAVRLEEARRVFLFLASMAGFRVA